MAKTFTFLFFFLCGLLMTERPVRAATPSAQPTAANSPVVFVQNKGQWGPDILFRADLPSGFLFLKKNALEYVFYDTQALAALHTPRADQALNGSVRAHGVEVRLEGSSTGARLEALHPSPTGIHYFLGNDPTRWAADVPAYSEVIYRDIYPGVNLRLFAYYQTLKYEFIVQPGADPALIRLVYDGADRVRLENGQLAVETSVQTFQESRPYSYVSQNSRAIEVPAQWTIQSYPNAQSATTSATLAQFRFPSGYDRSLPLTIDPELVFATYSGSRSDNWGHTATYDAAGNFYSGGTVFGSNMTVTRGAYQVNFAGEIDLAIHKFNADGTQLLYSTFLGGSLVETPNSLIVNKQGELIIYGVTSSANFPTTSGAARQRFAGGTAFAPSGNSFPSGSTLQGIYFKNGTDLYISKLSASGNALTGSTYVGGSGNDGINDTHLSGNAQTIRNYGDEFRGEVVLDTTDRIYVATTTASTDFPVTNGGKLNGASDGVVLRLNASLTQLEWATYLGGSGYDAAFGLKVGASGAVYVTGVTQSPDLPGTTGAYQSTNNGRWDGFIAKFSRDALERTTYLGTAGDDAGYLIDLDPQERPHVFGLTNGAYPVTTGVYQNANSGQFVHALTADLTASVFSTVIGSGRRGIPAISPTAFLVNSCGNIYLAGWGGRVNVITSNNTSSTTNGMPVTANAYKRTTNGSNFWMGILEREAKSLLYATFIGSSDSDATLSDGDHVDGGTCRFDKDGTVYHAACSCRNNHFPTTPQAWSAQNNSTACNSVAFKFNIDRLQAAFDTYEGAKKGVVQGCSPLTLTFINASDGGIRYEWRIAGATVSTDSVQTRYTFDKAGEYLVTLRAYNPLTCKQIDSTQQVIKVLPANFKVSPDTTICAQQSVQLKAEGATQYSWAPAAGMSSLTVANPVVAPSQTTTYTVQMTNEYGCTASKSVTVRIDNSYKPAFTIGSNTDCGKAMTLQFANQTAGADGYQWVMGNGDTLRVNTPEDYQYAESGHYEITLTASKNGCSLSTTLPVDVENLTQIPNVVTANNDGKNDVFNVGFSGARLEVYNRWGRQVFFSERYANNWGPGVPHGTYYYLLTTPNGVKCKGWVEVLE